MGKREKAAKELRKLEKRVAAARATETRRLQQLAAAQDSKGRKAVARRQRQAADAASEVTALVSKIAATAAMATGSAAGEVGGAVKRVGKAALQAADAVSPVKAPVARGRTSATTARELHHYPNDDDRSQDRREARHSAEEDGRDGDARDRRRQAGGRHEARGLAIDGRDPGHDR
jgi:hypothetical protein